LRGGAVELIPGGGCREDRTIVAVSSPYDAREADVKAILQVTKGAQSGEEFVLDAGQTALVGADKPARFVLSGDPSIERVHFAIEWRSGVLRIRDMKTPGGTYLNDERITDAELKDKDRIVAGETSLIVSVGREEAFEPAEQEQHTRPRPGSWSVRTEPATEEHGSTATALPRKAEERRPRSAISMPTTVGSSTAPSPIPPREAVRTQEAPTPGPEHVDQLKRHPIYSETKCKSGLFLYKPETAVPTPADLCGMLASGHRRVYLLADFTKTETSLPWDVKDPGYLFDWLPPDVAVETSPILIAHDQTWEFAETVDACWGCDASMCLITNTPQKALLNHLRSLTRAEATPPPERLTREDRPTLRTSLLGIESTPAAPSPGAREAVVAFYVPSVLASRLLDDPDETTDRIVEAVDAFIVEADAQAGWQLFTKQSFTTELEALGFVPADSVTPE